MHNISFFVGQARAQDMGRLGQISPGLHIHEQYTARMMFYVILHSPGHGHYHSTSLQHFAKISHIGAMFTELVNVCKNPVILAVLHWYEQCSSVGGCGWEEELYVVVCENTTLNPTIHRTPCSLSLSCRNFLGREKLLFNHPWKILQLLRNRLLILLINGYLI